MGYRLPLCEWDDLPSYFRFSVFSCGSFDKALFRLAGNSKGVIGLSVSGKTVKNNFDILDADS